jgi:aspartyl protease
MGLSMLFRLGLIFLFTEACFRLHAGQSRSLQEFPFEYREGLLWLKASISQSSQPLNFLLDTGAGASVINLSTAKRLGFKLGPKLAVRGVKANLTGYRLGRFSAAAGDVSLPGDYIALDLEKLSSSCQTPVDGLVGVDFFRGRVVRIDFLAQKIQILDLGEANQSTHAITLQSRPCGMRVPIRVDGHKQQWVRLDTGCASPLQWVTSRVRPEDCKRQVAVGLSELSIPQTQTTIEIGQQKFANVPTGLHENAIFAGEAGLLGNGLLARFSSVTIDAKAGRLILEP